MNIKLLLAILFSLLSLRCTEEEQQVSALEITESPLYNFGTVLVGANAEQTFTVTNSGAVEATSIDGLDFADSFDFKGGIYPGTGGTCATTLPTTSTCTVVLTFTPTTVGAATDILNIRYNNGDLNRLLSLELEGTGSNGSGALLTISDGPTYDYGNLATGNVSNHTFTVTNAGSLTATAISGTGLAAPFTFQGGSYPGTGGTCGASLATAATCTLVVSFSPTIVGLSTDTITLDYNDGSQLQSSNRNVQGTGTAGATATLVISDGPVYDYGTLATGNTVTKVFTVTNAGSFIATALSGTGLAAPFSFQGGVYPGTGGTCGATLAASGTCVMVIQFSPVAMGVFADTIQLDYNDGSQAQAATRDIQGTGI